MADVRTEQLRKIYTSPPPMASGGRGFGVPRLGGWRRGRSVGRGKGARKKDPRIVALDGVSLEVRSGEIFGLLGPNGAGKTTTVGILTTRVRPTEGHAWIGQHDVWVDPVAVKHMIGVVPQQPNLDFQLTAREILTFHGAYFGLSRAERNETADRLLTQFQLTERADQLVQGFSGGMAQRLSIARSLVHDPEVLFLDEPSAGLDPQTRLLLWEIVREYNRAGKTVLLTTHYMEEADTLCDRIAIIDHGSIIAQGTPAELKASIPGGYLVRIRFAGDPASLMPGLERLKGVREVRPTDRQVSGPPEAAQPAKVSEAAEPAGVSEAAELAEVSEAAEPAQDRDHGLDIYADRGGSLIPEIAAMAAEAAIGLSDMHIEEPSLETLFLHHTGRSLRE